jgi:hypothetical protein
LAETAPAAVVVEDGFLAVASGLGKVSGKVLSRKFALTRSLKFSRAGADDGLRPADKRFSQKI